MREFIYGALKSYCIIEASTFETLFPRTNTPPNSELILLERKNKETCKV